MNINEKGITIVTLVIMIILILIILGVSINIGTKILKSTELQNLNTNMLLIQAKARTISEEASFNKDTSILIGTKVSTTENQKILKLVSEGIIDDAENYYILSKEDLNNMGLSKIDEESKYIVNYNTNEIIYVDGFEANGSTYYKLSETKGLSI